MNNVFFEVVKFEIRKEMRGSIYYVVKWRLLVIGW